MPNPPSTQSACPTCGSDDPERIDGPDPEGEPTFLRPVPPCRDPFHSPDTQTEERCGCCGKPAPNRGDSDPWQGRMDAYCENCAETRCDAYPGACRQLSPPDPQGQVEAAPKPKDLPPAVTKQVAQDSIEQTPTEGIDDEREATPPNEHEESVLTDLRGSRYSRARESDCGQPPPQPPKGDQGSAGARECDGVRPQAAVALASPDTQTEERCGGDGWIWPKGALCEVPCPGCRDCQPPPPDPQGQVEEERPRHGDLWLNKHTGHVLGVLTVCNHHDEPFVSGHDYAQEGDAAAFAMPLADFLRDHLRIGVDPERLDQAERRVERIQAITMENWESAGEMANAMDRIYDLTDALLNPSSTSEGDA